MFKKFFEGRKLLKKLSDLVQSSIEIYNDPMNGCPGDFAEMYGRRIRKVIYELEILGVSDDKIFRAEKIGEARAEKTLDIMFGGNL
jgi:hypothetical protein